MAKVCPEIHALLNKPKNAVMQKWGGRVLDKELFGLGENVEHLVGI